MIILQKYDKAFIDKLWKSIYNRNMNISFVKYGKRKRYCKNEKV